MIDHRAGKHTYKDYKCKELLQQALAIDVKDDSTATHPELVSYPDPRHSSGRITSPLRGSRNLSAKSWPVECNN